MYDTSAAANRKVKNKNVPQFAGTGADGALSVSAGTTTIPLEGGFIEKNYSSISITGGTYTFSGPVTGGSVAIIRCLGDFTMSAGTISMDSLGAAI